MSHKTITLSEDAYNTLNILRKGKESFTDAILRNLSWATNLSWNTHLSFGCAGAGCEWNGMAWEEIIDEWHGSLTREAITEAVRLAREVLVAHAGELVQEPVSV